MSSAHLAISKIGPESDAILRELFGHYLRDMSEWFQLETKDDGTYAYDISSIWDKGYGVYLATADESPAGFALVGSAGEWLGIADTHDVHEFFVHRQFRRHGFGQKMAAFLWNEHPGEWLVRVLTANGTAVAFWRSAVANYSRGSYREDGHIVNERPWRFFRFGSIGAPSS
jgi:predicted acetyltransferase